MRQGRTNYMIAAICSQVITSGEGVRLVARPWEQRVAILSTLEFKNFGM